MNCEAMERDLALFVSGDLPETQAAEVEAHLNSCPACTWRREEFQAILEGLSELGAEPLAAGLSTVRANVLRQIYRKRVWEWSAAAAALLVMMAGMTAWRVSRMPVEPLTVAVAAPPAPARLQVEQAAAMPLQKRMRRVTRSAVPVPRVLARTELDGTTRVEMTTSDPNVVIVWLANGLEKKNEEENSGNSDRNGNVSDPRGPGER